MFTQEEVFKTVDMLSGGEKVRLALCKIFKTKPNVLVLDEPTNHVDIVGKETLESMMKDFPGSIIFVSHDRYFINRTASRIMDLTQDGFVNYLGNYDYYLEKKAQLSPVADTKSISAATMHSTAGLTATNNGNASTVSNGSDGKLDWKAQKEMQAAARKRENEISKLEALIEKLEMRDKEIDELMVSPEICNVSAKLIELQTEKDSIAEQLLEAMERWEELQSES